MYKNPEQDLDKLWKKKLAQGWNIPEKRVGTNPGEWSTSVTHYVTHPAYYHNYFLGDVWTAQMKETLQKRFGGLLTPEAGQFLLEHRSTGLLYGRDEQMVQMTGQHLTADPLIAQMTSIAEELMAKAPRPKGKL